MLFSKRNSLCSEKRLFPEKKFEVFHFNLCVCISLVLLLSFKTVLAILCSMKYMLTNCI
jgi:hypothetical protein